MGFIMYCSYGNGYRLTQNTAYRDILLQSAKSLITRFSPTTGCIRSWDFNKDVWQFPVIIDNMMNLELLFWAAKTSGDKHQGIAGKISPFSGKPENIQKHKTIALRASILSNTSEWCIMRRRF